MTSPYLITEPTGISFSGGRTSAYMLWKILQAHGGKLPDEAVVTFANTGKEMPQTLDFVQACSDHWGVDIVWLELKTMRKEEKEGKRNVLHKIIKITDYKNASRKGEPFDAFINAASAIPNAIQRSCTGNLKIRPIQWYLGKVLGWESPWNQMIGIRGDEKRRAVKIHNTIDGGQDRLCPLYIDGVTKEEVGAFWKAQPFDLELPNNNGVTDWGNCDLCHLKGKSKRMSIIRERPDLADWWIDVEKRKKQFFRPDEMSYQQMKVIATDQGNLFDFGDDPSIPCFCGD